MLKGEKFISVYGAAYDVRCEANEDTAGKFAIIIFIASYGSKFERHKKSSNRTKQNKMIHTNMSWWCPFDFRFVLFFHENVWTSAHQPKIPWTFFPNLVDTCDSMEKQSIDKCKAKWSTFIWFDLILYYRNKTKFTMNWDRTFFSFSGNKNNRDKNLQFTTVMSKWHKVGDWWRERERKRQYWNCYCSFSIYEGNSNKPDAIKDKPHRIKWCAQHHPSSSPSAATSSSPVGKDKRQYDARGSKAKKMIIFYYKIERHCLYFKQEN